MSLPGQIRPLSEHDDYACSHQDCFEPATYSLCTEADAMGAEYEYYCDEHIQELHETHADTLGTCEWCHIEGVVLSPVRDTEEGLSGPVYWVCTRCKKCQDMLEQDDDEDYDEMDMYDDPDDE